MRWHTVIFTLLVGTMPASCALLLDFEELQGGAASGDGGTTLPLEQLASAYAKAQCSRVARCFGALSKAALGDEDCAEYMEKVIGQSVFASLGTLDPTRFVYHPDKAPACLAAIEAADCDVMFPIPQACDAAIEGLVAAGGECTHPKECQGGLYCDVSQGTCPGTCMARPGEGQPCADGLCAKGLQCETIIDSVTTQPSDVCLAPASAQQPCDGGSYGGCRVDMFCLGKNATTPGKCIPIANLFVVTDGLACNWTEGSLCGPGLHCGLTDGTTLAGTCQGPATSGGACTASLPDMCPAGEFCDVIIGLGGICSKLPVGGQPCTRFGLKALCRKGNRCLGRDEADPLNTPGTCFGIVGLTDACTQDALCYSGHCDNDTCATPNYCELP